MSESGLLLSTVHRTAETLGSIHNPFESYVESGWNYMTDNYSEFAIATWISVILHEVLCRLCGQIYMQRSSVNSYARDQDMLCK